MTQDNDPGTNPPQGVPPSESTPPHPLGYGVQTPSASPYTGPTPTPEDMQMAMLAHLLGIIGFVGPLIIWLIKKDQSKFVDDQGKEALNFHITLLIGWIFIGILSRFVCFGVCLFPVMFVIAAVFSVMGALKAKEGIAYRYPFSLRLVK